jgi:C-terminal of Roc, COR, domain
MELMNKFELSYELPDKSSYLVPELLPKEEPDDFEWDEKDELCFIILMITFWSSTDIELVFSGKISKRLLIAF